MAFQPIILAAAALSLDGDAFEGQISGAVFTPTTGSATFAAINGQTYTLPTATTWTLDLTYAQDWNEATALSRYLHESEGSNVAAVFEPVDGQPAVTATVTIVPGAIGQADATTVVGSTVSLGVSGKPVVAPIV